MSEGKLATYYEGGTVDRWWVAPAGLGMVEAKKKKIGRLYKTRSGAMASIARKEREVETISDVTDYLGRQ